MPDRVHYHRTDLLPRHAGRDAGYVVGQAPTGAGYFNAASAVVLADSPTWMFFLLAHGTYGPKDPIP